MANQNVTGLTLTIFGVGLANFIGKFALNRTPTGTLKLPDGIAGQLKDIRFPFLEKIPGVGPWLYTLFSFNIFVYLAVAIAIVLAVYLNHTKTGRNLRALGDTPAAAVEALTNQGERVVSCAHVEHLLLTQTAAATLPALLSYAFQEPQQSTETQLWVVQADTLAECFSGERDTAQRMTCLLYTSPAPADHLPDRLRRRPPEPVSYTHLIPWRAGGRWTWPRRCPIPWSTSPGRPACAGWWTGCSPRRGAPPA